MKTKADKGNYFVIINGKYIINKFWTLSVIIIIISLLPIIIPTTFKKNQEILSMTVL